MSLSVLPIYVVDFIHCYLSILFIFWKIMVSPILYSEDFSCYEFLEFLLVWEVSVERQF